MRIAACKSCFHVRTHRKQKLGFLLRQHRVDTWKVHAQHRCEPRHLLGATQVVGTELLQHANAVRDAAYRAKCHQRQADFATDTIGDQLATQLVEVPRRLNEVLDRSGRRMHAIEAIDLEPNGIGFYVDQRIDHMRPHVRRPQNLVADRKRIDQRDVAAAVLI